MELRTRPRVVMKISRFVAIIIGAISASPSMAQVSDIIKLASYVNSLGGSAKDDGLAQSLSAIHVELDQIKANQEKIVEGLQLLSDQIAEMERNLMQEMNDLPYKVISKELVTTQQKLNNIGSMLDFIKNSPPDMRHEYLVFLRNELTSLKESLPVVMEQLVGIDVAYTKVQYPFIAGLSRRFFDLLRVAELLERYCDQQLGAKEATFDKQRPWYALKYSAIVTSLEKFTGNNRPYLAMRELARQIEEDISVPIPAGLHACFDYQVLKFTHMEQIEVKSKKTPWHCLSRDGGKGDCTRSETIYRNRLVVMDFEDFNMERFRAAPDKYFLDAEENQGGDNYVLVMQKYELPAPEEVATVITTGHNVVGHEVDYDDSDIRRREVHGPACNTFDVLQKVVKNQGNIPMDELKWCVERGACATSLDNFPELWHLYQKETSARALQIYTISIATDELLAIVNAAKARIELRVK